MRRLSTFSPGTRGFASFGLAAVSLFVMYKVSKILIKSKAKNLSPAPDGRLRTIFVTGGASGIGLRTTVKFLLEGWRVGVYDLNVNEVAKKICEVEPNLQPLLNERLVFKEFDVTDEDSCRAALEHFLSKTDGKLDCLFNCAGLGYGGPMERETWEEQRKIIRVNAEGVVQMTYICLETLKKTPGSCIVSMASIMSMGGMANFSVYAATKAFVYSFTETLRSELFHPYQIRACDVSVSFVDTPMVQNGTNEEQRKQLKSPLIKPEKVADTVFEAVQTCSYHKVHFYVNTGERVLFFLNFFFRAICPSLRTRFFDKFFQLEYQKFGKKENRK